MMYLLRFYIFSYILCAYLSGHCDKISARSIDVVPSIVSLIPEILLSVFLYFSPLYILDAAVLRDKEEPGAVYVHRAVCNSPISAPSKIIPHSPYGFPFFPYLAPQNTTEALIYENFCNAYPSPHFVPKFGM